MHSWARVPTIRRGCCWRKARRGHWSSRRSRISGSLEGEESAKAARKHLSREAEVTLGGDGDDGLELGEGHVDRER